MRIYPGYGAIAMIFSIITECYLFFAKLRMQLWGPSICNVPTAFISSAKYSERPVIKKTVEVSGSEQSSRSTDWL